MSDATGLPLRIEKDVARPVKLALQQQGVPFLRSLTVEHRGGVGLQDVEVTITTDPPFSEPLIVGFDLRILRSRGRPR